MVVAVVVAADNTVVAVDTVAVRALRRGDRPRFDTSAEVASAADKAVYSLHLQTWCYFDLPMPADTDFDERYKQLVVE